MKTNLPRLDAAPAVAATLLLALWLLGPVAARAQWTQPDAGQNISNTNAGNVGVGTGAPAHRLDVKGPDIRFGTYADDSGVTRSDSVSNTLFIARSSRSDANTTIGPGYGHKAMITTRETGQYVADMGAMIMLRSSYTTLGNAYYPYAWAGGNVELYYKRPGAMVAPYTSSTKFYDDTTALPAYTNLKPELGFILNSAGNVGIGTAGPAHKLDVAGAVRSSSGGFVFPDGTVQTTAGGANQWVNAASGISYGGGSVGIGTANLPSAPSRLTVFDTAQNAARVTLSGQEFYTPSASSAEGPALLVGVNRPGNRQLWIGDSAALAQNGTNAVLRVLVVSGAVGIDATGTDGQTLKPLSVGNGAGVTMSGGLDVAGEIKGGTISATFQDVAEWVPSTQKLEAGTVVVLDAGRTNHVVASGRAYDTSVAGVVSEQPGVILGVAGEGKVKVATTGRVKVKVDATRGAVKVGDLLVTGGAEGVAMRSVPVEFAGVQMHRPGTIIGKALEPLGRGVGEILVLLSLQ